MVDEQTCVFFCQHTCQCITNHHGGSSGYNEIDTIRRNTSYVESESSLIKMKEEYLQTFSVHGLTRLYSKSKLEAYSWTFIILTAVSISTWIISSMIGNYLKYNIYTELTSPLNAKNTFPSITICDLNEMIDHHFAYCNKKRSELHGDTTVPCTEPIREKQERLNRLNSTKLWSNSVFNVTLCYTWGGETCTSDKYLKSLSRYGHSCITLNHADDLYDSTYGHLYVEFEVNQTAVSSNPSISAIVHNPLVTEIDVTNRFVFEKSKVYELKIRKTMIKRLPPPFPSKCTYGHDLNIFPGKYTRRTCLESFTYLRTYQACGDILDYHKQHIPKGFLDKYKQNRTIDEVLRCFTEESSKLSERECPFPCEEIEYHVQVFSNSPNGKQADSKYRIHIQYANLDSYQMIEEKQLLTWRQVVANIGGLISLVLGASFISLIEILFYISLAVLHHGRKIQTYFLKKVRGRVHPEYY